MRVGFLRLNILPLLVLAHLQSALGLELSDRCDRPEPLPHGSFRMRRIFVRFTCNRGFHLQGPTLVLCQNGRLKGDRPVCAKRGCETPPDEPEHGYVEIERTLKAILTCDDNFAVAGNHFAYCDGQSWDRPLGTCRELTGAHNHFCDFETNDMCGWTTDQLFYTATWNRVMAANIFTSFRTGPRHDHTLKFSDSGHYMLMESMGVSYLPQHLISPTYSHELSLKTACCFRFHYFMYGAGVGTLTVSVKPKSLGLEVMWLDRDKYIKFRLEGNQNNNWNEHLINIDEQQEDFNIVFTTSGTRSHLGDVAIDDVQLLTGSDCPSRYSSTTPATVTEETEMALFDMLSCVGRCGDSTDMMVSRRDGKLFGYCSCHLECVITDSCCMDYTTICGALEITEPTTEEEDVSTIALVTQRQTPTTTTTTTTPAPTTTTTTTPAPTTTTPTTTTSTTTKRPTTPTTTTSTTTTTTRKPTLPTTRRATTTSRKPITTTTSTTTTTRKPTTKRTTTTTTATTTTTSTTTTTTTTTRKPKLETNATTTTTTTTIRQPNTTTTTTISPSTSSTTSRMPFIAPTKTPTTPVEKKIWKVTESDLKGQSGSSANGSRGMLLLMLVIIAGICGAAVAYRCKGNIRSLLPSANSGHYETDSIVARFTQRVKVNTQEKLTDLRDRSRQPGCRSNRDSMTNELLCDEDDFDRFDDAAECGRITLHNKISEL